MFLTKCKIVSINILKSKFGGCFMVIKCTENDKTYTLKGKHNATELKVIKIKP